MFAISGTSSLALDVLFRTRLQNSFCTSSQGQPTFRTANHKFLLIRAGFSLRLSRLVPRIVKNVCVHWMLLRSFVFNTAL